MGNSIYYIQSNGVDLEPLEITFQETLIAYLKGEAERTSQADVARRFDLPTSRISELLAGDREPTFFHVEKIAKAMGTSEFLIALLRVATKMSAATPIHAPTGSGMAHPDAAKALSEVGEAGTARRRGGGQSREPRESGPKG